MNDELARKGSRSASEAPSDESGPELLQRLGMDAAKWCAEMVQRGVVQADPIPGEQFHGWMCNAIMAAYDMGHAAGERRVTNDQMLPLLRMALKMPLPWMVGAKHPKAVSFDEWVNAVDSVMAVLDKAKASWVDPGSKEARDERAASEQVAEASVSPDREAGRTPPPSKGTNT